MKLIKKVYVSLLLGFLLSLTFIYSGSTQATVKFKVEPTYATGRVGDYAYVTTNVYDADMDEHTDLAAYQVCMAWNETVLEMETDAFGAPTGIIWGDFMDTVRVGWWGELTMDAPAGQKVVNITGGSYYTEPSIWGGLILIQDDSHSEWNTVVDVLGNKLTLETNLVYSYTVAANGGAYPKPSLSPGATLGPAGNRIMAGQTTNGPCPGVSGSGWLLTFKFKVLTEAETTLDIDAIPLLGSFTFIINTLGECIGDDPSGSGDPGNYQSELLKESGYFVPAWPEDVNADGIIDIFDIAYVGIDWGSGPIQTKSPTSCTGGWNTPTYAYVSDDAYAWKGDKSSTTETYSGYGFNIGTPAVAKVEVGLEHYQDGNEHILVRVSGNGGSSWGSDHSITPGETEVFEWIDVTADLSWTPSMLTDANFRVEIEFEWAGGTSNVYVDWLPVRVTPDPVAYSLYTDIDGDGIVNIVDLTMVSLKFGETY